jgi:hypothetical protein
MSSSTDAALCVQVTHGLCIATMIIATPDPSQADPGACASMVARWPESGIRSGAGRRSRPDLPMCFLDNRLKAMKFIQNGDLLVWKKTDSSNVWQKAISLFTQSPYVHVAVAVWRNGAVHVLDADFPKVELKRLQYRDNIYRLPMNVRWDEAKSRQLIGYIGQDYSIPQALISFFGRPPVDDSWHCVEVTKDFYRSIGIKIKSGYTPKSFVAGAQKIAGCEPFKLRP